MVGLYRKIEQWWFSFFSDKIRFILVGGFNTVFAYVLFVILSCFIGYNISLILTYIVATNLSIFTMRYYVFASKGKWLEQYTKALFTYVLLILANYVFLYVAIEIMQQKVWVAQAEYTILSTITLYLVHKKINFKN